MSIPAGIAFDYSGAADGALVTDALNTSAKIGGTGWTCSHSTGISHSTGVPFGSHIRIDAESPSYAVPFSIGGTPYDASDSRIIEVDFTGRTSGDNKWERWEVNAPASGIGSKFTLQAFVKLGAIGNAAGSPRQDLLALSHGGFSVAQQHVYFEVPTTAGEVHAHSDQGHTVGSNLELATWYLVTVHCDGSNTTRVRVALASTGATVSDTSLACTVSSAVTALQFANSYLDAYGGKNYFKGIVGAWGDDATFPLGGRISAATATFGILNIG